MPGGRRGLAAAVQPISPGQVLELQQTAGNRATAELISRGRGLTVQRDPVETDFGTFTDTHYQPMSKSFPRVKKIGVDMVLNFAPNDKVVDAEMIGLTQSIKAYVDGGQPAHARAGHAARTVGQGPGEGYRLDRHEHYENNPIYGATPQPANARLEDTPMSEQGGRSATTASSNYQIGYRYQKDGAFQTQDAWLKDGPEMEASKNSGQTFETAALVLKGKQAGTYLGSVRWGWQSNDTVEAHKLPLELVSRGNPSANFTEAAKKWNEAIVNQKGGADAQTTKAKTAVAKPDGSLHFSLEAGRLLKVHLVRYVGPTGYAQITVDPSQDMKPGLGPGGAEVQVANVFGWVRLTDIAQPNSDQKTIPLPIGGGG